MKRKALTLFLISWLAVSTLTAKEFASLTKANPSSIVMAPIEHAYVRSNGDIDPPTLPIQRLGDVYVLKDNILNYTIEIQKDNIMIDGNGFTLTSIFKTDDLIGLVTGFPSIQISNKSNIIIQNIKFDKCYTGISVKNSSNVIIIQNTMVNGDSGIYMSSCTNCSIIGNKLIDNSGTGLNIMDSTFLNIAYNAISRNHGHGGWIAISYSNISRNNITDNSFNHFGIGLYLYGPNSNNRIFENNFINNENGLFYQGTPGISVNNKVYDNYWSNYEDAIVNIAADAASGVDRSPLTSPISTSFDPSLYPWLSPIPTPSPTPSAQSNSEPFPTTIIVVSLASMAAVSISLLLYFKKRNH